MGQYRTLSRGDPWYTVHLVDSRRSGEKKSGAETGTSPKQEKRSLHPEWCSATQAACPSYDDYACPIWRPAARPHIRKMLVLQSRCLRIATSAPWYVGNKQIHDDLIVHFFTDHIRSLRIRLKVSRCGEPLSYAARLDRYLRWPSDDPESPKAGKSGLTTCHGYPKRRPCRHIESCPLGTLRLPWIGFFFFRCFFPQL